MKRLVIFLLMITLFVSEGGFAKTKKSKKRRVSSSKVIKLKKKRKYRRGNGPDIKKITIDSPYVEEPTNGVNPIEKN